jgi:hypothetical protein
MGEKVLKLLSRNAHTILSFQSAMPKVARDKFKKARGVSSAEPVNLVFL